MRLNAAVIILILASCPEMLATQQRDGGPQKPVLETATVTGVIQSGGQPTSPVGRAIVTVTGGSAVRSTLSGDDGRFSIDRLPAGTYSVVARKAGWLSSTYGATRPGSAGVPLVVVDGSRVEAPLTMFRGAAITGVLRDNLGEPVMGVPVFAIDTRTGTPARLPVSAELSVSDDRGVYRLYGLPPGVYFVAAAPPPTAGGRTGALSTHEIEGAIAMLTARTASTGLDATDANLPVSRPVYYAPTFHPGTAFVEQALRVKLEAGEERSNVDIDVTPVSVGGVEGLVQVDATDRLTLRIDLLPYQVIAAAVSSSIQTKLPDTAGAFSFSNVPPGRYRVISRINTGRSDQAGAVPIQMSEESHRVLMSRTTPSVPSGDFLYAHADVDVRGGDRPNVTLVFQPGGVISGQLRVNAGTAKPLDVSRVRLSVQPDPSPTSPVPRGALIADAISAVRPDGTFELRGIGPGRFRLTVAEIADGNVRWHAQSARLGDRDLLDEWIEFGPGLSLPDVVVTLTDRRSGVDGLLQSASGQPSSSVSVIVLPANRELWRAGSRRIVSARPHSDGRFTFDVPPGDYALAAVTDLDPLDLLEPEFLEQIVGAGVKVTVAAGERTRQDVRIK